MERRHRLSTSIKVVNGFPAFTDNHRYHVIRIYKGTASIDNYNRTVPEYTIAQTHTTIPEIYGRYNATWNDIKMKPSDSTLLGLVLHTFKKRKVGEIRAA